MSEEMIECPACGGTGKRKLAEVARERVFGPADRMAKAMGARFRLNDLGEKALAAGIAKLRAQEKELK